MDVNTYKIILSIFIIILVLALAVQFRAILRKHREALEIIGGPLLVVIGFIASMAKSPFILCFMGIAILGSSIYYLSLSKLFYNSSYNWKRSNVFRLSILFMIINIIANYMRRDKTHFVEQIPTNPDIYYWIFHINIFSSMAMTNLAKSFRYIQGIFSVEIRSNEGITTKRFIGLLGCSAISLFFLAGLIIATLFMLGNSYFYRLLSFFHICMLFFLLISISFLPSNMRFIPSFITNPAKIISKAIFTSIKGLESQILLPLHFYTTSVTPSVRFKLTSIELRILPEISDSRRRILSHYPYLPERWRSFHEAQLIAYLYRSGIRYHRSGPYQHYATFDVRRHNLAVGFWTIWFLAIHNLSRQSATFRA